MKQKPKSKKKIPYQYKPEGLDLRTWQIMLRKQVAREERFSVSAVDENLAPGEYRESRVWIPTRLSTVVLKAHGTIVRAWTLRLRSWVRVNILKP